MTYNALTTETQYANIDNKKIAYRKFGNGSPIIFANRFRGTLDTWDPLFLNLLAETNTVITFDYSGIGYSEGELPTDIKVVAAEAVKIANYLKIDKFIAGGWSYGGLVAQYTTFLFPERIISSIIIGSNPMGKNSIPLSPLFLERPLMPNYSEEDITVLFFEPKLEISRIAAPNKGSAVPIPSTILAYLFVIRSIISWETPFELTSFRSFLYDSSANNTNIA